MQQTGFNWQEFGKNAFVVHIDIDQAELQKGHPRTDLKLAVDANDFLCRLLDDSYPEWSDWLQYAHEVLQLLPLDDPENKTGEGFVSPFDFYLISSVRPSSQLEREAFHLPHLTGSLSYFRRLRF
jgi:acetolactate synthase-1/2/3 large subunit